MISMCLHATEIYEKLSQKREMLSVKVLSLMTGAWKTALIIIIITKNDLILNSTPENRL